DRRRNRGTGRSIGYKAPSQGIVWSGRAGVRSSARQATGEDEGQNSRRKSEANGIIHEKRLRTTILTVGERSIARRGTPKPDSELERKMFGRTGLAQKEGQ